MQYLLGDNIDICIATIDDLDKILDFQKGIIDRMPHKEFFTPLTNQEFITPIEGKDNVYLLYYEEEMMGLAVATCDIPDVLAEYDLPDANYMLIDSIMISEPYRGSKLQQQLLDYLYNRAYILDMDYIVATIHPDNIYSLNSFYNKGYEFLHVSQLHGGPRCVLVKQVIAKE